MNPLTNMRNQNKLNEREIRLGYAGDDKRSWHGKYKDSAWVYVGGLPYTLTEGDVICVFSQYGELVNINLIRDHKTGKPKGFCFLCYEDQRSTNLAVDNLNGAKIAGRMIRVDHVDEYKVPKLHDDTSEKTKSLYAEGCAPKPIKEARRPDEAPSEEEDVAVRPIDTDMLLPMDKEQKRDIKRVKKRLKKEAKEVRRAKRAKLEEAAAFDREHGGTGEMKPTTSAWSWSKAKAGREGDDDENFRAEHRVQMAHFDQMKIKERHLGKAGASSGLNYHEEEILKMEREREKRLAGDTTKGLKRGDKAYVPKRFAGHSSARL